MPKPRSHESILTEQQRQMYAAEKLENFRWISKLVATYSSYTLTRADLVDDEICKEVAELGEFTFTPLRHMANLFPPRPICRNSLQCCTDRMPH